MIDLEIARPRDFALAHRDERRTIYDPNEILKATNGCGRWYSHGVMKVEKDCARLGNHFHDYWELFFAPTGGFDFRFVDIDNLKNKRRYVLEAGQRIILPPRVGHVVTAKEGSVILTYGTVVFDKNRLIPFDKLPNKEEIVRAFDSLD